MITRVWGDGGPPQHHDGTPVITPRLWAVLTPIERLIYSAEPLTAWLSAVLFPEIGDDLIDGYSLEDFVQHGLSWASSYSDVSSPGAVLRWCRQELWRRRRRQKRYLLKAEPLDCEYQPPQADKLPPHVRDWLDESVPADAGKPRLVDALVWMAEQGYSVPQVAELFDIPPHRVYSALRKLRNRMKEE